MVLQKLIKRYAIVQNCFSFNKKLLCSCNSVLQNEHSYFESSDLKENLNRRNIILDLQNLKSLSEIYRNLKEKKSKLENLRINISDEIISLKTKEGCEEKKNSLNVTAKILRNDLKVVKLLLANTENSLKPLALKLPNDIDSKTLDTEVEIFESNFKKGPPSQHHLKIGKSINVLEYYNPTNYYLYSKAALFDIQVSTYVLNRLTTNSFILLSNPDFSRSVVTDLCNEINDKTIFSLGQCTSENDILYLNGGASYLPFVIFCLKTIVGEDSLPLRFVSQGRNYCSNNLNLDDLYSVCQNNAIQVFALTSHKTVSSEFDNIVNLVTKIYEDLDIPFRVIYSPARSLYHSESLRASFQVYSMYHQMFIECGNISLYKDYFSKRFNIFYDTDSSLSHANLVAGTIIKLSPLLACVLEFTENCDLPKSVSQRFNKIEFS